MKLIDISWPIFPGMSEYKDRNSVQFQQTKTFEKDQARETLMSMHVHTGTHVDAPAHFIHHGKTIEQVDVHSICGPCQVIDCTQVPEKITENDLAHHALHASDIILLKTSNSALEPTQPFHQQFVYLEHSGAQYLIQKKVKAVGIDYIGIERSQRNHETHTALLSHDISIIEGLRLGHVKPGAYFLICLPLLTIGIDAAPARAVLLAPSGD